MMFTICVAAACAAVSLLALAQTQPTFPLKPIRIVVPSSAGGTQDTLARLLAPRLSELQALLLGGPGFAVGAAVHANLPYDPLKDFSGVAQIGHSATALVVSLALGVKFAKVAKAAGLVAK